MEVHLLFNKMDISDPREAFHLGQMFETQASSILGLRVICILPMEEDHI